MAKLALSEHYQIYVIPLLNSTEEKLTLEM